MTPPQSNAEQPLAMSVPTIDEKRLEVWTKTAAFAAVIIYACGYLIISTRDASFGFAVGEVIKPRMLAAGATFSFLSFLPVYFAHKIIPQPGVHNLKDFAKKTVGLLSYSFEVISLIFVKSIFIHADPASVPAATHHFGWRDWLTIVGIAALMLGVSYLARSGNRHAENRPFLIAVVCLLCIGTGLYLLDQQISSGDSATTIWLFGQGILGSWIYRKFVRRDMGLGALASVVYLALLSLTFYSNLVFPHIYQEWGGGQPVPIEISLLDSKTNTPSAFIQAELIDEESKGVFMQYGDHDVAVFVPDKDISRVCYLERGQPHGLSEVFIPSLIQFENPSTGNGCTPPPPLTHQ